LPVIAVALVIVASRLSTAMKVATKPNTVADTGMDTG
jgi:hypothetical protein